MLIQIKHRSQSFAGRPTTRISKFIDNLIITINLKSHGENYGCFKAGSTHFLKQSNLFSLFFSVRSTMIDHQFSRYFTILQSKVTQITQINWFLNFESILVISSERFILLPILAILEYNHAIASDV